MRCVRLGGFLVCGLGVLVACSSVEVIGIDGGLLEGGAPDAAAEGSSDATVNDGAGQDQSADQSSEGSAEGSPDAPGSEDAPGEASGDAGEAGGADSGDAGNPEGSTPDASGDAPGETGSSEEAGAQDAGGDAPSDAATDAPPEAAACTVAANWSMTVQTITATPTLCQGFMDCTNCDIQSNATSSEPSAGTLDWSNLTPGGTLCNSFAGTITSGGVFTTSETDCSPAGDGTTFDGQIDVATCSMTGTYVYVLSNCTVTFTMTGTQ